MRERDDEDHKGAGERAVLGEVKCKKLKVKSDSCRFAGFENI
jgi:hypothetical protein